MSFKSKLAMTIPNSDLSFDCKNMKIIENYLFIITSTNEIIIFKKEDDLINKVSYFDKKYIILSNYQTREDIFNLFIMNAPDSILNEEEKYIVVISNNLILHYYNLSDGLCVDKINLSKFKNDNILLINSLHSRFLLIIFSKKIIIYDIFTHLIFKEEQTKFLNKIIDNEKNEFINFEIKKIYKIKENSYYLLSTHNDSFFLNIEKLNNIKNYGINFEECRIRLIKQTFDLNKFFNEDSIITIYNNEYIFFNTNKIIKLAFLDSVEELTEISNYNTKSQFSIIDLKTIVINSNINNNYLLVIYKDLSIELFTYDKKIREIKHYKKFILMVEDEFLNMKYDTTDNVLIGYTKDIIHNFDLRRINKNNEKYSDKIINLKDLFNIKSKKIFFTNYFNINFNDYINNILQEIIPPPKNNENFKVLNLLENQEKLNNSFKITSSIFFCYSLNKTIYYIIGTNTGKVIMFDIFFTEQLKLNPIIIIDYHSTEIINFSIFNNRILITSSIDGLISFTDIGLNKIESAINTVMINKKEYYDENIDNILNNNNINDGYFSLNENNKKINKNVINERKKSGDEINMDFTYSYKIKLKNEMKRLDSKNIATNSINLVPNFNLKTFNKLIRILPIIPLDHDLNYKFMSDDEKNKNKNLLAFYLENNEIIILRLDLFLIVYKYNQSTLNLKVKSIYHVSIQKSFIFYLENNSIKICNYSSKTCDRYITNEDKIYKILRVKDTMIKYFKHPNKIDDLILNNDDSKLKFDENIYNNVEYKKNNKINLNKEKNITVENIRKIIYDEKVKKIFIIKLFNIINNNNQKIDKTLSQFEAIWIKKIENLIIDDIIKIINQNISDKLKMIQITNCLYNPQFFMKIQDRYGELTDNGITLEYLYLGKQYSQMIMFNYEDYFLFLEKKTKENKLSKNIFRTNYYNFISLFYLWNFHLDLDVFFYHNFKLCQPIFDFYPLLIGIDSSCSLLLVDEKKVEKNFNFSKNFSNHFNYFLNYSKLEEKDRIIFKNKNIKNLFFDRVQLLETQQCFLVNLKNYKGSNSLSHHLNLILYGGLISILGFDENKNFCINIGKEKYIMNIIAKNNKIFYTNFYMLHNFMYENNETLLTTNKDLLLYDYLEMQYNIVSKNKYDINLKKRFLNKINKIIKYIEDVYRYIFDLNNKDEIIFNNFYKITKDSTLEYNSQKMDFLSEFELSLITILMSYNDIIEINENKNDRLPDTIMIQITQLLVLYVLKIIKYKLINQEIALCKNVCLLLAVSSKRLESIYTNESINNYVMILIQLYTSLNIPLNEEYFFRKIDIGKYKIIKSEDNQIHIKYVLINHIKMFFKNNLDLLLKNILNEFNKNNLSNEQYSFLIELIYYLFYKPSYKNVKYLSSVFELLMFTLNPQLKELKYTCLENSKKLIVHLINHYPMITFHHNTQKIAVGNQNGIIEIYDMTNGNNWRKIPAHKKEINALIFDNSGNIIISYCSEEYCVKIWKIGLTNFFSSLFSNDYKQIRFNEIKKNEKDNINKEDLIKNIKFKILPKNPNEILLIREDKSVEVIKI